MALRADGNAIRTRRLRRGMNGAQFARTIGISRYYLSNIETETRRGSPEIRLRIANALGVDLDDITYDDAQAPAGPAKQVA